MSKEDNRNCGNCRFMKVGWMKLRECHRNAPVFIQSRSGDYVSRWPPTHEQNWCGDWKATDEANRQWWKNWSEQYKNQMENDREALENGKE